MNRRSLFGVIALSPIMAVEAFAKEKPTGQPTSSHSALTLMGTRSERDGSIMYLSSSIDGPAFMNLPKQDPSKAVTMAVGEDGALWLKKNGGEWKRVVTE